MSTPAFAGPFQSGSGNAYQSNQTAAHEKISKSYCKSHPTDPRCEPQQ